MHLIWHIFKKDARLMRGPLAAWVGLFLMTFAIAGFISWPAGAGAVPDANTWFGSVYVLFMTVMWLSAYFFAAIPVHDDSVAGGEAFWPTRPVSRLQLLGAKLLGLVVFFGLLPWLLGLLWWWGHGFNLGEIWLATKESLQSSLTVAVLAFTLASVTNSGREFYRWTLGLLGVAIAVAIWLLLTRTGNFAVNRMLGGAILEDSVTLRLTVWRGLAMAMALWLGLIAIGQFLAPNRQRTILLSAIFIVLGIFFATFPVGPSVPRKPVELSVSAAETNALLGKITLTEHSHPRAVAILKYATLSAGPALEWRVTVSRGSEELNQAAEYFSHASGEQGLGIAYPIFPAKKGQPMLAKGMVLKGEGEIWQQEYVLSVPLAEGQETTLGSRRLRIDHFGASQAQGIPGGLGGVVLALTESMPVFAEDVNLRPAGLSEFYLLVTPSGAKRIRPYFSPTFVSSSVGVRTSIFSLGANPVDLLPDRNLAAAGSMRLVKVGLRRVGWFQETIPVVPEAGTTAR